ncbi:MAG: AI-2E family transporter [Proteobacteria bacterium]|nr:AI-2E family transporter [Pseudomonadota bacterium]
MDSLAPAWSSPTTFLGRVVCVLLVLAAAFLFWRLGGVLLLAFSAVLLAIALRALADGLRKLVPLPQSLALAAVVVLVIGAIAGILALFGWRIAGQYDEIISRVEASGRTTAQFLSRHAWGRYLIAQAHQAQIADATGAVAPLLRSLLGATGQYVAYAAIVLASGVFLALDPERHRRGVLLLVPPAHRPRVGAFLDRSGDILRRWLVSRVVVMIAIGVLSSAGLSLLGIDAALTLGLTGAVLTFIPLIGALLAAAPAVLVALAQSPILALWTAIMFWGVHFIEGTFITPLVQDERVNLPPVLTIFSTLVFTVLFGPSGILLASPMMLVVLVALQMFWLEDALGETPAPDMARRPLWRRLRPVRVNEEKGA